MLDVTTVVRTTAQARDHKLPVPVPALVPVVPRATNGYGRLRPSPYFFLSTVYLLKYIAVVVSPLSTN